MVQKPDLLKKPIEAASDARDRVQDHLESLLDEISKAAQDQRDQVQQFTQQLVDRSQKNTDQLVKVIDREIRRQLAVAGIATKADIRRLEKKIETLQKAGGSAKKAAKATGKKATAKAAAGKAASAKKTVAKKTAKKSA